MQPGAWAFCDSVDDLDALKDRLRAAGIAFSELGKSAIPSLRFEAVNDSVKSRISTGCGVAALRLRCDGRVIG